MIVETNTSRAELQAACRARAADLGHMRTWIASATVEAMRAYLAGGDVPASQAPSSGLASLADALKQAAAESVAEVVDACLADKWAAVESKLDALCKPVEVHIVGRPVVTLTERVHACLPAVLRKLNAGLPVLLVGPAGSGKTTLAKQAAKAMGLAFTFNSMSGGVTESALLGAVSPMTGEYHASSFAAAYGAGGLHLLDEIDAADPNLLVQVNAAIANGHLAIPRANKIIDRAADFFLVGAANTYGQGPDSRYVGREQLDAATLDRFTMGRVFVGYDTGLESGIVGQLLGESAADELLTWAHAVRGSIDAHKLQRIMSTRVLIDAAKLMAAGETLADVQETYFQGWSVDEKRRVN